MTTRTIWLALAALSLSSTLTARRTMAETQSACEQIQQACGEAGFTRDNPSGRDLDTKCYKPIMGGQDVKGVHVDSSLVKKCQAENQPKKSGGKKRKSHPSPQSTSTD